jgi:hypothetical protein
MRAGCCLRKTWRLSLIGLAVAMSCAGAQAQVYRGNDTGGIIPWSCENEADAKAIAGAYCAGWNKYARITSVHRMYGDYIAFNCLWRPDIARYQIPAVRARSSCYAQARRLHPRVQVRY